MSNVHSARYQKFLQKFRKARLDSGLTQLGVARRLKKPQSYVSKCESGERRVDVAELQLFAKLYKKPLSYFEA
jgi:transcriptional regulator with XRE-family HTH domain